MKQKKVGSYHLGFESCEVVLIPGLGAEYHQCPEKGKIVRIKVGADVENWHMVVSNLLHEAIEFSLERSDHRYCPS